jgi:hypothetical protein
MISAALSRRLALLTFCASALGLAWLWRRCSGSDAGTAQIRALNLTADLPSIDLYTDTTKQFSAVATDALGSYSGVGAATYTLKVNRAGDGATLLSGSYTLSKDQHYTAVVWGRETALRLSTLPEDEDNNNITDRQFAPAHLQRHHRHRRAGHLRHLIDGRHRRNLANPGRAGLGFAQRLPRPVRRHLPAACHRRGRPQRRAPGHPGLHAGRQEAQHPHHHRRYQRRAGQRHPAGTAEHRHHAEEHQGACARGGQHERRRQRGRQRGRHHPGRRPASPSVGPYTLVNAGTWTSPCASTAT